MYIYINKKKRVLASEIIEDDNYFIKEYFIKPSKIIKEIADNEIKFNNILVKNNFKNAPKLVVVEYSNNSTRLSFEKIYNIKKFRNQFKKRLSNFRKLLYIVSELHSLNICHMDLNMSNIILTYNDVYIVDFALSKDLTSENAIYDIKSLELFARKLFRNNEIVFTKDNMLEVIEEWSTKYEPLFKE